MKGYLSTFLLLLCPLTGAADDLGRLFTTAEERARLERGSPTGSSAPLPSPAPVVEYQGLIHRSGGRPIVLINHRAFEVGHMEAGVTLSGLNRSVAVVQLGKAPVRVNLKPGQRWEAPSGVAGTPP